MEAEWVAVAVAIIGMFGSLISALWSNAERRRADEAADRAEARAEEAVAALRGIETAVAGPVVAFEIRYRTGDQFELVNTGRERATGVTTTSLTGQQQHTAGIEIGPGEGVLFLADGVHQAIVNCDQFDVPTTVTLPPKRK